MRARGRMGSRARTCVPRLGAVTKLTIVMNGLIKRNHIVGADGHNEKEDAISNKGIKQGEAEAQELQLLRILIERDFFLLNLLEATPADIAGAFLGVVPDLAGTLVALSFIPVGVENFGCMVLMFTMSQKILNHVHFKELWNERSIQLDYVWYHLLNLIQQSLAASATSAILSNWICSIYKKDRFATQHNLTLEYRMPTNVITILVKLRSLQANSMKMSKAPINQYQKSLQKRPWQSILGYAIYYFKLILRMVNIFVVRHKQPKDIPFTKSPSNKNIVGAKYQNTCKLTTIVVIICMSTLYYGLCLSMISAVSSPVIGAYFGSWAGQSSTIGLLIGFFPIGGAVGAVCSRLFIKYLTRKQILIIFDVVAIVITGLLQIPNIGLLMALRILQGFVVGVFMAVVPMYVNELVPIDLHGSEGVISQILIVVGVVIDYIFKVTFNQSKANTQLYWRFVFGFSGLPCLIQLIFLAINYVPESPMSLIKKGQMDEAKAVLGMFNINEVLNDVMAEMVHESKKGEMKKIAKDNGITHEMSKKQIESASARGFELVNTSLQSIKAEGETSRIFSAILQMYAKQKNLQPEVHRILSEHHLAVEPVPYVEQKVPKKAMFLGFELHFMQQFSGIKMVITETSVLFTKYNATLSLYAPFVANLFQLAATCVSTCILGKYGRKKPTLVGNFVICLLNFIMAALFLANAITNQVKLAYAAAAFIILFMITYALSIGPVVWPYVPEIMPSKYVPFASSMNWIAAAICTIATPYILDAVGSPYPVFFFFGVICLVFFFINSRLLIETKGLTPSQIANKLSK